MKKLFAVLMLLSLKVYASTQPSGLVKVDGSSTVFPLTEAVAEEFNKKFPNVRVMVGVSGTGGGFKKFTAGEIDISDASRTIKKEESDMASKNNIEYFEVPVSYDGIVVVTNKNNGWAKTMTVAELKRIWEPESKVKTWKNLRPEWPNRPIKLYGPGTDSGTFDYFTEAIVGKAKSSRSDYSKSEDDNVLVQGVAGDLDSLGYFGHSYYLENIKKLNAVSIDNGKGPVEGTEANIGNGTYAPLSRKVYIYVSKAAAKREEIREFVKFYIENAATLAKEIGQVALSKEDYQKAAKGFEKFMGI
ncbi:MAG: PstS family phosphate ABC transporter substrate-binding protein [Bacteriovoracales bacterium]